MTIVYNHKYLKSIKRLLRKQDIGAEKILWSKLRNRQQIFKFRRQYSIGGYVADFYCPKLKLAIEVDGATHSTKIEIQKDKDKENFFKRFGIKTIRYNNTDIYHETESVISDIYERCLRRKEELKKSNTRWHETSPQPSP